MHRFFRRFSERTSEAVGSPWVFLLAVVIVAVWAVSGPLFNYSNGWQLVINTGTTIVTFLMVFLIQNTQNRDSSAIHLKLDELLRAMKGARTSLVDLETLTDEDLDRLHREFHRLHVEAEDRGTGPGAGEALQAVGDTLAHAGERLERETVRSEGQSQQVDAAAMDGGRGTPNGH